MQTAAPTVRHEEKTSAEERTAQARLLLWASAGMLETLALLGGMYWIMTANDSGPLALRVGLVAALAVTCGLVTLLLYSRINRRP